MQSSGQRIILQGKKNKYPAGTSIRSVLKSFHLDWRSQNRNITRKVEHQRTEYQHNRITYLFCAPEGNNKFPPHKITPNCNL